MQASEMSTQSWQCPHLGLRAEHLLNEVFLLLKPHQHEKDAKYLHTRPYHSVPFGRVSRKRCLFFRAILNGSEVVGASFGRYRT